MLENASIRLIACPHMFSVQKDRIDRLVSAGASVASYMRDLEWDDRKTLNARVYIDGRLIERACWETMTTQPGQSLVMRVIPQGGDTGKTILRIVGVLAVVVVSIMTVNPALGAQGLAGVLGLTGSAAAAFAAVGTSIFAMAATLALNAPVPPPLPRQALSVQAIEHGPRRIQ